jgi:hypothetical protein
MSDLVRSQRIDAICTSSYIVILYLTLEFSLTAALCVVQCTCVAVHTA